jgi:hypothetical protein
MIVPFKMEKIMKNQYKVTTSCTLISEYEVYAHSEEEAEEIYLDGDFEKMEMVDFKDERIDTITKEIVPKLSPNADD